jgi:hypothetical protein
LQLLAQPEAAQQGFDPSIFINPGRLHLTLLMLKLYSDEARHKAAQALQGMQPQVGRQGLNEEAHSRTAALPAMAAVSKGTSGHNCRKIFAWDGPHGWSKSHLTLWPGCTLLLDASVNRKPGCLLPVQVQQLLGGQPLRLSLKGLDYMSDDPTDMHVLYL